MTTAMDWLEPLRSSVSELDSAGWERLERLYNQVGTLAATVPQFADQATRSRSLLAVRRQLAGCADQELNDPVAGAIRQTLVQFCIGFHDLDLRDAVGPGHGAMILAEASQPIAEHWQCRLDRGDLVGIAATEWRGGSRLQEITTRARPAGRDRWRISGEKVWVSRLHESSAFVVFFRDPDNRITAGLVDAAAPGLHREVVDPFGLAGWSWGLLQFHGVSFDPAADLVGPVGEGLGVFRRHFSRFRPLVTATALGAAAGVHSFTTTVLAAKLTEGALSRIRDNALIVLGRTYAEITAALLSALTTSRLAAMGHPGADLSARLGKAAGVDAAYRAVTDLAPLLGAAGFQRSSMIAKVRADLTGLLYADGIHDSLYRSGGRSLMCQRSSTKHDEPTQQMRSPSSR
ncbi:acyl-CoA dehydrogenase family protein [Dactylosporangium sucinum]|uniref:acyl-CoA dehydrogenase family protein n=1 Tax=Dactylosporangium sucinum TaxID=1424081 RepID=UPI001E2AE38F|nr:acyl-CoA dehydrogenase family protein [Dactylosporangium sucinum]